MKKNAGAANIKDMGKPKRRVKATIAECKAKNPLECKYHGLKTLEGVISSLFKEKGVKAPFSVSVADRAKGVYSIELEGENSNNFDIMDYDIVPLLESKGLQQLEWTAYQPSKKAVVGKFKLSNGFVTPKEEKQLIAEDDLGDATEAPKGLDEFLERYGDEGGDEVEEGAGPEGLDEFLEEYGESGEAEGGDEGDEDAEKLKEVAAAFEELSDAAVSSGASLEWDAKVAAAITSKFYEGVEGKDLEKAGEALQELAELCKQYSAKEAKSGGEGVDDLPGKMMSIHSAFKKKVSEVLNSEAWLEMDGAEKDEAIGYEDKFNAAFIDYDTAKMGEALRGLEAFCKEHGIGGEGGEPGGVTLAEVTEWYNKIFGKPADESQYAKYVDVVNNGTYEGKPLEGAAIKCFHYILDKHKDESKVGKKLAETLAKLEGSAKGGSDGISKEEVKDWFKKVFDFTPSEDMVDLWEEIVAKGTMEGKELPPNNFVYYEELIAKAPDHKVSKAFAETLEKLEKGGAEGAGLTYEDIVDWLKKTGGHVSYAPEFLENIKSVVEKGVDSHGESMSKGLIKDYKKMMEMAPDHKVSKVLAETLAKMKGVKGKSSVEGGGEPSDVTLEEVKDWYGKIFPYAYPKEAAYKEILGAINTGRWQNGDSMTDYEIGMYKKAIAGKTDKVSKKFAETLLMLESGEGESGDVTFEEVKEWYKEHFFDPSPNKVFIDPYYELIAKGTWNNGQKPTSYDIKVLKGLVSGKGDKVSKKIVDVLEKLEKGVEIEAKKEIKKGKVSDGLKAALFGEKGGFGKGLSEGDLQHWLEECDIWDLTGEKLKGFLEKPKWDLGSGEVATLKKACGKKHKNSEVTEAVKGALASIGALPKKAGDGYGVGLSGEVLKPLEHDAGKFPSKGITAGEIEAAIEAGTVLGGHGGCQATLIELGGRKYVCKRGKGFHAVHLKNGYYADMAYRAAGVLAPDAEVYEYKDGRTFKLSEYIEGEMLLKAWNAAGEEKREGIRKEILKGYPLDALFSNHDVLGTGFDNIMLDKKGRAWRIDNDGSFAMSATGKLKTWDYGDMDKVVEVEKYEYWDEREWIDDFRKMRRMARNKGIFDHYTTADVFWAAGNLDLGAAVAALPEVHQKALAKPLAEMKQMTRRAVSFAQGGYKDREYVSMALDASYEASKMGLRELCEGSVSWKNPGFGKMSKNKVGLYQKKPFEENPPEEPKDPAEVMANKLENSDYTGSFLGQKFYKAAKSINYHCGVKSKGPNGEVLGSGDVVTPPDYKPKEDKVGILEKVDRSKLAELAKVDKSAEALLGMYDEMMASKESGWKKPVGVVHAGLNTAAKLPKGYKSPWEKEQLEKMEVLKAEYEAAKKKYEEEELPKYWKAKAAHEEAEEAKAKAAGESAYVGFNDFANKFILEGIDTDGRHNVVATNGVDPIEESMKDQKGNSYKGNAKDWKIRLWRGMGYSFDEIRGNLKSGVFQNNEWLDNGDMLSTLAKCEADTASFKRDMASQAMYNGLLMLYLENVKNESIDKESGCVFVNRNVPKKEKLHGLTSEEEELAKSATGTGWIRGRPYAAADCCQFESNSWNKEEDNLKQVYALPFANVVCCGNFSDLKGKEMESGFGENEWACNLDMMPCFVYKYANKWDWKEAMENAKENEGMKGWLEKLRSRLEVNAA